MQERLQKIIARAGVASRRRAEQLISSGQVKVNGQVVRELGSKADSATDKIEVSGRKIEEQDRKVYLLMNKPPEIVSTLSDPEGRKTLVNLLRGFPERVYPVGNLEYSASGLVFLTNDGDYAADMLRNWGNIEQIYHVKVKGMLTRLDLDRLGKEIGAKMQTLRQPDATRGKTANYWYEVRMRSSKKEEMRKVLFKERHPVEKVKRVAMGMLTVEGIPRGRYRLLNNKEAELFRNEMKGIRDARAKPPRAAHPQPKPFRANPAHAKQSQVKRSDTKDERGR
jgi:23S rRNA pseudouridine2605 synthase